LLQKILPKISQSSIEETPEKVSERPNAEKLVAREELVDNRRIETRVP